MQKSVVLTARPAPRPSFRWVSELLPHLVLLFLTFTSVMPFVWMFFGSFKTYVELTSSKALLPVVWTFDNYIQITQRLGFMRGFFNTALVAVVVTGATLLTSALAGYVFAKYRFWGRERLFTLLLATMMVPFAVVLVPLYVTVANLGLADQLLGIIITGLCSTFGIFLMRQFMESIPNDLIDAGRIDGASEWWIFARVVMPLAKAPLSALAVFTFLGSWDNFLWPLVVLTSPENRTLPLVLAGLRSLYWSRYEMFAAGSMLTVLPVMIIYAFASKQFVRGIAMTGLKA
ncbi:MAG: carbohydrate ABC transporter permease [Caldilineaceae bacterium]|nr:carbohydrate ABC transporter permease [Caldilineaceae bacterium]